MICGLANASDAIEVLCISFQLPSAECELRLTSADKGWLSAVMFIGRKSERKIPSYFKNKRIYL